MSRRARLLVASALSLFLGSVAWGQAEAPDPAMPARPAATKPAPKAKAAPKAKRKAPAAKPAEDAPVDLLGATPADGGAPLDPYAEQPSGDVAQVAVPPRLSISDLAAMQGLLAVQRLDGWLLHDREGNNQAALQLVAPSVLPRHVWYYLLPGSGEPVLVCHQEDAAAFEALPGKKLPYQNTRELQKALRDALKGRKTVAMEVLDPYPGVPTKFEKDAQGVLRALKIKVASSDHLVQYTRAVWGQAGYRSHHIAAHHLVELRKDALTFIASRLRAGQPVTELEVQERLVRNMAMRRVVGPEPSVAAGLHTADPLYLPTAQKSAAIKEGDLILISLAVRLDEPGSIFAAQTWVAYAGATVPERVAKIFDTVVQARQQVLSLIGDRFAKRRPLRGHEVGQAARAVMTKGGLGRQQFHSAGHSIDTALDGSGADLDDAEAKDLRTLVAGTGVTVGPGAYFTGELGVRSEITVFLSPSGPQVTTPAQTEVEALLAAPAQ